MGGRSGIVHEELCNQQIAEFAALEYAVHFVSALGWDGVGLVGDTFSVLQSFAAGKASVGCECRIEFSDGWYTRARGRVGRGICAGSQGNATRRIL